MQSYLSGKGGHSKFAEKAKTIAENANIPPLGSPSGWPTVLSTSQQKMPASPLHLAGRSDSNLLLVQIRDNLA
jgi:hypothetical protein